MFPRLKIAFLIGSTITLGGLTLLAASFLPVSYQHILSRGTDTYETHYRLYFNTIASQTITTRHPLASLAIIPAVLVPDRPIAPLRLDVVAAAGTHYAILLSPEAADDAFVWVSLPENLPPGDVTITASAPAATNQTPLGVRYKAESGDLALALQYELPVWQRVQYWWLDHPSTAQHLTTTSFTVAALLVSLGVLAILPVSPRTKIVIGLIALAAVTAAVRFPLAARLDSAFGGDAFNYLLKSQAWLAGEDPFATDPRKSPLLSFLLLPSFAVPVDYLTFGRAINGIAAAATAVVTALILIRLRLPYYLALAGGLLLVMNREFQWETIHTLANPLHTLFITAAAYAFLYHAHDTGRYLVGLFAGLAFLARYEGGVAAILLPFTWLYHRLRPAIIARTLLPAVILIAIPFLVWPLTGNPGVRTAGDIEDDPGLYLAQDIESALINLDRLKEFIGRLWFLQPLVGEQWRALGLGVLLGIIITLTIALQTPKKNHLFPAVPPKRARTGRAVPRSEAAASTTGDSVGTRLPDRQVKEVFNLLFPLALAGVLIYTLVVDSPEATKQVSLLITALTGLGIGHAVIREPKYALPIGFMLLLHTAVITAILPKTRYYLPLVPFLTVALVIGIASLLDKSRLSRLATLLAVALLIGSVAADANHHLPPAISDYNTKSIDQTLSRAAGRYLEHQSGTVAIAGFDLPLHIYLAHERRLIPSGKTREILTDNADQQLAWLQEQQPTYLFESETKPFWTVLTAYPEHFTLEQTFSTPSAGEQAYLYRFIP